MSTLINFVSGKFHLSIKLKGTLEAITHFHNLAGLCDTDWPWEPKKRRGFYVCPHCCGVEYTNPRINPEDLKAAARQANVGIKIYHYADGARCVTQNTTTVPVDSPTDQNECYQHKPGRLRKVLKALQTPPLVAV